VTLGRALYYWIWFRLLISLEWVIFIYLFWEHNFDTLFFIISASYVGRRE
jgi:hypothetical protein